MASWARQRQQITEAADGGARALLPQAGAVDREARASAGPRRNTMAAIRTKLRLRSSAPASPSRTVQKETGRVDGDGSAFRNALGRAKEKNLTLIYDEAHTIFRSPDLCSDLFKTSGHYRPRVLLFSFRGSFNYGAAICSGYTI